MADQTKPALTVQSKSGFAALSDSERLLITSLRTIARSLAEATCGMSERDTEAYIEEEIFELIQSLGGASEPFAVETERYLRLAVGRARAH